MLCRIQKFMPTSLYLVIKKETRRSLLKNIQFLYQGAIENRRLREVTV